MGRGCKLLITDRTTEENRPWAVVTLREGTQCDELDGGFVTRRSRHL